MKILILGGTVFLGRHLVAAALEGGHELSIFNRGNNYLNEQDAVERIVGDRSTDLTALSRRKWDAIIDTSCMEIEHAQKAIEALENSTEKYVLISSISAFKSFIEIGNTEKSQSKLTPLAEEQDYGSKKAWSEKLIQDAFASRALIIRPGLIIGRYDPSDRFTYWVQRVKQGSEVLCPGRRERLVQFIDVRDLSEWILRLIEAKVISGIFSATGPAFKLSMSELLISIRETVKSDCSFTWIDDKQLLAAEVKPWIEMPLWIPESDEEHKGFMQINCIKAENTGLSFRPLHLSIADIFDWHRTRNVAELKAGIGLAAEKDLLKRFKRENQQ